MRNILKNKLAILSLLLIFTYPTVAEADTNLIIRAKGTKVNGVYAHFKVIVNDLACGSKYSASACKEYCFEVPFNANEINKVEIVFDNDHYSSGEDRNLFVNCIYVGNELPIKANKETVKYFTRNGEEVDFEGLMQWNGTLLFDLTKIHMHNGDVVISSQEELNHFEIQYVNGDLTISGPDIIDLSPLASLASVKGALIISENASLINLEGLNSLLEVGFLSIDNNPNLTMIDGLNALIQCGGMYIGKNKSLETIKCFNSPDIM